MPAFRILDQAPQYLLADGQVNAGGLLYTFETDLTTPKTTWSDQGETTPNANPIVLDSAGRVPVDIWGDGEYGLEMQDAEGVTQWTRNNVEIPGGTGTTIPALVAGQYLSNDGSNLAWQPILQVPDPTGLANYYLVSDGSGTPLWQQIPDAPVVPDPDIVVGTTDFTAGVSDDETKWFVQRGSSTAPSSGSHTTSTGVTFPEEFKEAPMVFLELTQAAMCPAGLIGTHSVTSPSVSGFTANFDTNVDDDRSQFNISSAVNFNWLAIGRRTVTA